MNTPPSPETFHFAQRPRAARWLERLILPLDRLCNRLYGSRYNPLYQSGALALLFLLVLTVTGIYLLIFYQIRAPYASVRGIEEQVWAGRWIRALHSYAGDAMMLAVLVHVVRMLIGGRTWGPRVLAWVSGVMLLGLMLLSGWTGLVLAWDVQAELVAVEGARMLDLLPIFSEPIALTFTGGTGITSNFFFLNLMLHMVFPVVTLLAVWVHTSRVARPVILPPRKLALWSMAGLTLLAIVWPIGMLPPSDRLRMLGEVPVDIFYGAWLLLARHTEPSETLLVMTFAAAVPFTVPLWWRPRLTFRQTGQPQAPAPAWVNQELCTGCIQCYLDCPYQAITMVTAPETNTATELVAQVTTSMCTACGICAGSCAPMVVGPPGRRGRDLLLDMQRFFEREHPGADEVVAMVCAQSAGAALVEAPPPGVHVYALHCAGASHTSAMEYLMRRGVGGVYVLSCPPRDCFYRRGPHWLHQRIHEDREAELHARVDRRRIRIGYFSRADEPLARADMTAFRSAAAMAAEHVTDEGQIDLNTLCEAMQESPA